MDSGAAESTRDGKGIDINVRGGPQGSTRKDEDTDRRVYNHVNHFSSPHVILLRRVTCESRVLCKSYGLADHMGEVVM